MDRQLDNFYRAWCTPELRLLGYRLRRPYCLGTALLLEAADSPFADLESDGSVEINAGDLLVALKICQDGTWPFNFVDLRPRLMDRVYCWWIERKTARLQMAVRTLVAWMRDCSPRPEFWRAEGDDRGPVLTAPHLLARAVKLLRTTPLQEERIWSMPYGLLAWYDGAIAEQQSDGASFFYDSDLEACEELPDLNQASEEELYHLVLKDRGKEFADYWLSERRKAAQNS